MNLGYHSVTESMPNMSSGLSSTMIYLLAITGLVISSQECHSPPSNSSNCWKDLSSRQSSELPLAFRISIPLELLPCKCFFSPLLTYKLLSQIYLKGDINYNHHSHQTREKRVYLRLKYLSRNWAYWCMHVTQAPWKAEAGEQQIQAQPEELSNSVKPCLKV